MDSKKIDKRHLVLSIYKKLFEISEEDHTIIGNSVNFLCDNRLVEKIPTIQKYSSLISNFIRKLEKVIMERPENWLWSHKRWKIKFHDSYQLNN